MRYLYAPLVLMTALFLLLSSCGETGFFLDDTGGEDFVIESIDEGALLKRYDEITVALLYEEGVYNPESLEILLMDQDGEVVGSSLLEGADLVDPLPPVSLPELDPGYYIIRYTVKTGEELLAEEDFPFFYTEEDYLIQGISIYPPVIFPEGSGLLQAELLIPEGADPFLRWTSDDVLIYEGTLSDGADRIQWQAPGTAGAYAISLEVFPFGAGTSDFYSFHSTVSHQARLYVGDKQGFSKADLLPEESYYSLFHFKGSLVDTGTESDGSGLLESGRPVLDIREGVFGYYLDGASGFTAGRSLLPLSAEEPQPFSVTFKFLLEGVQADRNFFALLSASGEGLFSISSDAEGSPFLSLMTDYGSTVVPSEIPGYTLESVKELTVSLIPGEESSLVQWFADGGYAYSEEVPFVFSIPESGAYTSVIGGEEGFTGLLDEFGAYYRTESGESSAEQHIFRRSMKARHGSSLLFADGLDGHVEPGVYQLEGTYSFTGGALVLAGETSLGIPEISLDRGDFRLVLEAESADGSAPVMYMHPERENTLVFGFGPVETAAAPITDYAGVIDCSFSSKEDALLLTLEGVEEPIRLEGVGDTLSILLDNSVESSALLIHSLLIYTTSTKIADTGGPEAVPASL